MKIFSLNILPYEQDLIIVYKPKSAQKVAKDIKSMLSKKFVYQINNEFIQILQDKIDNTSNANFIFNSKTALALIVIKYDSTYHIVHEVCHFVFWLLDRVGLPLKLETDESYTYLIANTYKRIVKELNL